MTTPRAPATHDLLVALALVVAVALVYWPVAGHDFVNYDAATYVSDNPYLRGLFTLDGLRWAFTTGYAGNWHPLTWVSHALDWQLFGLRPSGHHLVNVALHAVNSVLLFVALRRLTATFWRSAFVAALFALHPAHVESVAWAAERKDVLSAFFWMLILLAYAAYARRPSLARYFMVAAALACGLMSKPMVVTLPCVLLLLDWWPLARSSPKRLVLEKIPLLLLSVGSSIATFFAQRHEGAVATLEDLSFSARLGTAAFGYGAYLAQAFWPAGLAVFYPMNEVVWWRIGLGLLAVLGVSALAWWQRTQRPWLAVGWAWYLGTLVPVIGLVQVGDQCMADRYTYLPLIGIFIIVAWAGAEMMPRARVALAGVAVAVLVLCGGLASAQVRVWRDSGTLFAHALAVTRENAPAHNGFALHLAAQGRIDEAIGHYQASLRTGRETSDVRNNLGSAFARTGRLAEAIEQYEAALRLFPNSPQTHNNLANALAGLGRADEAIPHFREALRLEPKYAYAHFNLANALAGKRDLAGAVEHYRAALAIKPELTQAQHKLALTLVAQGAFDEAGQHYREALRQQPDFAAAHNDYGILLARRQRLEEAIEHFSAATRLLATYPEAQNNLGQALATRGDFAGAREHFAEALRLRPDYPNARRNLAWLLATSPDDRIRNGAEAIALAEKLATATSRRIATVLDTLAAAYAEAGRFDDAISTAEEALALAAQDAALASALQSRLAMYRAGRPYRESTSSQR